MGTTDVIGTDNFSNATLTSFLDKQFPLRGGTHSDVQTYLVYFDHLMAIRADGTTTSLVTPSQFQHADGSLNGPSKITLSSGDTHVQIHLHRSQSGVASQHPCIDKVYVQTVLSA